MAYTKTTWVDGSAPAISAANLNNIEQGVADSLRTDGTTTMTGQIVTVAGSATTPAIAPTGDSNNGIFFPAADTIALGTAGSERVRVTSAGNVGIGKTANIDNKLDVVGSIRSTSETTNIGFINSGLCVERTTNDSQFSIGYKTTPDAWILQATYNSTGAFKPISFATTDAIRMTIATNGNVGIGTNSPSYKLHVIDTSATSTTVGANIIARLQSNASNADCVMQFSDGVSSAVKFGMNAGNFVWLSDNTTERMRLTSTGNVGIGTTSPSAKLELSDGTITLQHDLVAGGGYVGTKSNHPLVLFTNNTEKMRLTTAGYLLVGYTASNGAYPLQVNGQIFATSSTIATSDARYKENVTPLTGALDLVNALNPVQFDWKKHQVHNFNTEQPTVGFLAQEVAEVLKDQPYLNSVVKKSECTWETETGEFIEVTKQIEVDGELVDETVQEAVKETHTEEFYGIAESNLIAILTKAVQELSAEVQALKAQISVK